MTNLSFDSKIAKNLNIRKILKLRGIVTLKNYFIDYVKYKGVYVL